MKTIKVIFKTCALNLYRVIFGLRYLCMFLLILIYLRYNLKSLYDYLEQNNLKITIWCIPHILSNTNILFMYMLGIVFLFCDAPFIDFLHYKIIYKIGRIKWLIAQVMFLLIMSIIYYLFYCICIFLYLFKHIEIKNSWGEVMITSARGFLQGDYIFSSLISKNIIDEFKPIEALVTNFILLILISLFLGLVIMLINIITQKIMGGLLGTFLVFLSNAVFFNIYLARFYSPVSWGSLYQITKYNVKMYPKLSYCIINLTIVILILFLMNLCIFKIKKIDIKMYYLK